LSDRYSAFEDLTERPPLFDMYICGSDQVWNPYFTSTGEGKLTLSYFLDFGDSKIKRIAYAVSFGCSEYPDELLKRIIPALSRFDGISVRENSGIEIVRQAGINDVSLVVDPTLLLQMQEYANLALPVSKAVMRGKYVFFYTLHSGQVFLKDLLTYLSEKLACSIIDTASPEYSIIAIEQWLGLIQSASCVVTNSYHGMIFSLIFRIPFVIVLVEGEKAGMNDRIITLLKKVGLENRILNGFDKKKLDTILASHIDWSLVECRIEELRNNARKFFSPYFH
jgi:hypothetical protein